MSVVRVLHVMPTFHRCSITDIVQNIIDGTDHSDYEWHVAAPGPGDTQQEFADSGAHILNYMATSLRGGKRIFKMIISAQRLKRYIRENNIQLVHTHTPTTTILAWLALLGDRKVKCLYTKHYLDIPQDRGWSYTLVDRISMYQPDYLIPVSRTMGDQIRTFPGLKDANIYPIQNAIDHARFYTPDERDSCREEFGFMPDHVVFGFTGRLEKVKRIDLLLQAFALIYANYPHARLLVVGKGSLEEDLRGQTRELGIADGVIWAGWRGDITRLLAGMDVYVQPSDNEGLSLSVLEAMAAQKAVIATQVGGIYEVIEDGTSGLLVPAGDVNALAAAFRRYLDDSVKRGQIADCAREFVVSYFDLRRMTSAYDTLYKQCMARMLNGHVSASAT